MKKDNFIESYYKETDAYREKDGMLISINVPEYRYNILKLINSEIMRYTLEAFNNVLSKMESPIEELIAGSLFILGIENYDHIEVRSRDECISWGGGPDDLFIYPQHQIGNYRVDFYLELYEKFTIRKKSIVIECDGHEYHETKEAAKKDKAKDRNLQLCGYSIFRYTGSEIYRNPFKCAQETIDYLNK